MLGSRLEVAALTDVGRVRRFNEDTVAADKEHGIAIVADGMGGHRAGGVASRMAQDLVLAGLRSRDSQLRQMPSQVIERLLQQANASIFTAAQENPAYRGMGTTLAMMLFRGAAVTLAHVGDSRIYRLRAGRLGLLTRDDSLLRDQVEQGLISAQEAGYSHNRHLVTQVLGIQGHVSVHLREASVRAGDVFLACSDGLTDLVDDADIALIMSSLHMNLPLAASHLVQLANDNGGFDNISVVLVKALAASPAPTFSGWLRRLLDRIR